jgi:ankyrin repeat protein
MRAEHMTRGGHDFTFITGNYKVKTHARQEWLYVAGDENGKRMDPPASDMTHDLGNGHIIRRIIQPIEELLTKKLAKDANLTREEMIAIVMYTGPAFVLYNAVLRRFPDDIFKVFKDADNLFPTTIFVLVSAINKLSRCMDIPPGTLLYRGLGGTLEFPDSFYRATAKCTTPNALGFLEYGFMSTTAERSVAVQYSGVKERRPRACIMQIRPNSVDRGADVSEFSQYPGEREFLFVPYSFVQCEGHHRTEIVDGGGALTVVSVRVNVNLKTETVEELKEKKKRLHLASGNAMVDELRCEMNAWMASDEAQVRLKREIDCTRVKAEDSHPTAKIHMALNRLQGGKDPGSEKHLSTLVAASVNQFVAVLKRHEKTSVQEYVDDGAFRALVNEILDAKAWAKEKLELWMHDESHSINSVQKLPLREGHRLWQSFLRHCIDVAAVGSSQRASYSLKLLLSRDRVKRGVRGEMNLDGEDVIVQAGADGWTAGDIEAAVAAGADVGAVDKNGSNGICNAARYGYSESLTALIAGRVDANHCDSLGRSPIYLAVRYGHSECILQLATARCDANQRANDGSFPILIAAQNGYSACISRLLSANVEPNKLLYGGPRGPTTPLYVAVENGHTACIMELISGGSNVNQLVEGYSPIYVAASKGFDACLALLLSAKGDPNIGQPLCDGGKSPIFSAAGNGHVECIALLVSAKGNVNQCNLGGESPIVTSVRHATCVSELLSYGPDLNQVLIALRNARQGSKTNCIHLLEAHARSIAEDNTRASPVFICGATGSNAVSINGGFFPTGEKGLDGRVIYKKVGDSSICIEHFGGQWCVQKMPRKRLAYVSGNCALEVCNIRVSLVISGASGPQAFIVNGIFDASEEIFQGQSVYIKRNNPELCIHFWAASGSWFVASIANNAAKGNKGHACIKHTGGLEAASSLSTWRVANGKIFTDQHEVRVRFLGDAKWNVDDGDQSSMTIVTGAAAELKVSDCFIRANRHNPSTRLGCYTRCRL